MLSLMHDRPKGHTDPFTSPDPQAERAHRTYSALYRLQERHASTPVTRGRQAATHVITPQEAVRLIQQKYAEESADMAKRVTENLGWIEQGWRGIKNAAADAWDAMKSIGRESTIQQRIAELELEREQNRQANNGWILQSWKEATLNKEIGELRSQLRSQEIADQYQQQATRDNASATAGMKYFDENATKNLSKREQMQRELNQSAAKYQDILKGVGDETIRQKYAVEYQKDQARIRANYAEKEHEERKKALEDYSKTIRMSDDAKKAGRAQAGTYEMAKAFQDMAGDNLWRFGAFMNGHQGLKSKHNSGLAFDATPSKKVNLDEKRAFPEKIKAYLGGLGFDSSIDYSVWFEPKGKKNKNGSVSTADHWHFHWAN